MKWTFQQIQEGGNPLPRNTATNLHDQMGGSRTASSLPPRPRSQAERNDVGLKVKRCQAEEIETEAYNAGWLAGYDELVDDLHQGFNGAMPKWLVSLVGGRKVIANALSRKDDDLNIAVVRDYQSGFEDGYNELLAEIIDGYQQKVAEMPAFLQEIVGHEPPDVSQRAKE